MSKFWYLWVGAIVVIVSLIIFAIRDWNSTHIDHADNSESRLDTLVIPPPIEPNKLYGIEIDSFEIKHGIIKRNQFLADILKDYNVTSQQVHELSKKSKQVYDVRKLAYRKPYALIHEKDSLKTASYFIYESSKLEYVVYKLKDSIEVYKQFRDLDTVEHVVTGIIENSLWDTMIEADALPQLIHTLSEVFAWQVDFYRINKGDKFKVIYEQIKVEEEPVGIGKILGAYFNHFDGEYYAIHFDQGSGISYFDENGQSLQKQFLKAPLRYKRISSRYTRRRYHPVQKRYKAHLGTDYAAAPGTPIRTIGDGIVEEARYNNYNGRYVKIRHNSVYSTQYLHMSGFAKGIRKGAKVIQGQTIGYVGSTGLANGPHLCFRFWKNGQQVDALKVELPPSEPVKEEYRKIFDEIKDYMIFKLDSIPFNSNKEMIVADVGNTY